MKRFRNGLLGICVVMLAFFCAVTISTSIKPTTTYALTGQTDEESPDSVVKNLELAEIQEYSLQGN